VTPDVNEGDGDVDETRDDDDETEAVAPTPTLVTLQPISWRLRLSSLQQLLNKLPSFKAGLSIVLLLPQWLAQQVLNQLQWH
jgi:hypothetical protein